MRDDIMMNYLMNWNYLFDGGSLVLLFGESWVWMMILSGGCGGHNYYLRHQPVKMALAYGPPPTMMMILLL